jgi:hypothetical protein
MKRKQIQYEIAEQQRTMSVAVLESLAVTLFAVVTAALLPQLIYQLIAQNEQLVNSAANFVALRYLPHIAYAIAFGYFVVGVLGNLVRSRRLRALKRELAMLNYTEDGCCGGSCPECMPEGMKMDEDASTDDVGALAEAMQASVKKTAKKATRKSKK